MRWTRTACRPVPRVRATHRRITMPYHADVIGSLLRPRYLSEARAALAAGRISNEDFKRIEDRAVDQAIAMQEGVGLDVVNDVVDDVQPDTFLHGDGLVDRAVLDPLEVLVADPPGGQRGARLGEVTRTQQRADHVGVVRHRDPPVGGSNPRYWPTCGPGPAHRRRPQPSPSGTSCRAQPRSSARGCGARGQTAGDAVEEEGESEVELLVGRRAGRVGEPAGQHRVTAARGGQVADLGQRGRQVRGIIQLVPLGSSGPLRPPGGRCRGCAGGVRRTAYWNLASEYPGPTDHLQMMHLLIGKLPLLGYRDGAPRVRHPAADTFALLAGQLAGARRVTRVEIASRPGLYAFEVDRDGRDPLLVLWDQRDAFAGEDEPPVTVAWPWPAAAAVVTDAFGQTESVQAGDGQVELKVGATPVFVTGPGR